MTRMFHCSPGLGPLKACRPRRHRSGRTCVSGNPRASPRGRIRVTAKPRGRRAERSPPAFLFTGDPGRRFRRLDGWPGDRPVRHTLGHERYLRAEGRDQWRHLDAAPCKGARGRDWPQGFAISRAEALPEVAWARALTEAAVSRLHDTRKRSRERRLHEAGPGAKCPTSWSMHLGGRHELRSLSGPRGLRRGKAMIAPRTLMKAMSSAAMSRMPSGQDSMRGRTSFLSGDRACPALGPWARRAARMSDQTPMSDPLLI